MSNIIRVKDSNGNWIGIPALQGEPGITPHIGENGNWFLGEEDTGVKANIDLTPYATTEEVNQAINAIDIPTKVSELTNDSGFITGYTETDPLYSADKDKLALKTELPTKTSELTNDSGFLTQHQDISNLATKAELPTKISELTNDTSFITNTVSNLTNYYKKSETYTQTEVNNLINAITTLNIQVVSTLPTSNISTTTIYLKGSETTGTNDYEEWIYVNSGWELIGTTAVDLTPYATKTYVGEQIAGVTKSSLGLGNVENKSSATIREELTSANVTTALGYTPLKTAYTLPVATGSALGGVKSGTDITVDASGNVSVNDNSHNHSASNITSGTIANDRLPTDRFSFLGQFIKVPTSVEAEQYYKIFTITPLSAGYKDAYYIFEVAARSRTLTEVHLALSTGNDNYFTGVLAEYAGNTTIANNLKVYYYKDETNATSRIELWAKVTSWNQLSFYPKTLFNRNAITITWNMELGENFPTNFTTEYSLAKKAWAGNSATATLANQANQVHIARSASTGYYPILLTNNGDGVTAKQDTVYAAKNNTVTMDPSAGKVKATGFVGSGAELTALNASNISSGTISSDRLPTVPIAKGGTGATTAAGALTNLGITATAAELNYVDGVTSNIQTQLNAKATVAYVDNAIANAGGGSGESSLTRTTNAYFGW